MIVVADTSLFVALANIGQLDLLPRLFGRVLIPPQVRANSSRPSDPKRFGRSWPPLPSGSKSRPRWRSNRSPICTWGRRPPLALPEMPAELLVIDETQGRKAAGDRGLTVTGTIGVLEAAAKRGLVRLEDEFERLKRMGFWVNPKLLDARLALFREGRHEPETAAGQDQGSQQPEEKERNRDRGHEQ